MNVEIAADETLHPNVKLQELIHLAELCVDLIMENNEYYAEVKNIRKMKYI